MSGGNYRGDRPRGQAFVHRRVCRSPAWLGEVGRERLEVGKATLLPVLPLRLSWGGGELSLFSVLSTFGTAQDVVADELRMESLFPSDEATVMWFRVLGKSETA